MGARVLINGTRYYRPITGSVISSASLITSGTYGRNNRPAAAKEWLFFLLPR
jgi:hypothetical protein